MPSNSAPSGHSSVAHYSSASPRRSRGSLCGSRSGGRCRGSSSAAPSQRSRRRGAWTSCSSWPSPRPYRSPPPPAGTRRSTARSRGRRSARATPPARSPTRSGPRGEATRSGSASAPQPSRAREEPGRWPPQPRASPRCGRSRRHRSSLRRSRDRSPASGVGSRRGRRARDRRPNLRPVPAARGGLGRRGSARAAGRGVRARRGLLAPPPLRARAGPRAHPRPRGSPAANARERGRREHCSRLRALTARRRRLHGARRGSRPPRGRDRVRPPVRRSRGALPRAHVPRRRRFCIARRTTYVMEPMYGNSRIATSQAIFAPVE